MRQVAHHVERPIDDERAARLVALLPERALVVLRKGPVPWGPAGDDDPDGDCRTCAALDEWAFSGGNYRFGKEARAALRLFDWHQGWDLRDTPGFMLGRGTECFRRCVVIYRAAGWTGDVEAPPPDPLCV